LIFQLDFVVKRLEGEQDYVFLISSGLQYYSYLKQPKATRLLMRYFKKDILLHPFSDELYYISDYAFVELKKIIKGLPKKKVAARRWLNNRNFEKLKYK